MNPIEVIKAYVASWFVFALKRWVAEPKTRVTKMPEVKEGNIRRNQFQTVRFLAAKVLRGAHKITSMQGETSALNCGS